MPAPADFTAHSLQSELLPSGMGVRELDNMLKASEMEEVMVEERRKERLAGEIFDDRKTGSDEPLAGEIFDDQKAGSDEPSLSDFLADINDKDAQLRLAGQVERVVPGSKIAHGVPETDLHQPPEVERVVPGSKMPPVRNARPVRNIQTGKSRVEEAKEAAKLAKEGKDPSKHQKYYSYEYFKEWDTFDVDKEIERIEKEEKAKDEFKTFSKKAVDYGDEVHDPNKTYSIEMMSALEKRHAAKREKEKGNECMKAGEINAAVAYYTKALELVPGDHLVLGNRAQAYIGIRCYYQSEVDCDKALAIDPAYFKARYRRAVAKKEQHKYGESLEDLTELLRTNPEHTLGVKLLQEVEYKKKEKDDKEAKKAKEESDRTQYENAPRRKIMIQETDDDDEEEDEEGGMDSVAMLATDDDDEEDEKGVMEAVAMLATDDDDEKDGEEGGMDSVAMLAAKESLRKKQDNESDAKESSRLKAEKEGELLRLGAARAEKAKGNDAFKANDLPGALLHYTRAMAALPDGDKEEAHLILSNRAMVHLKAKSFLLAESDSSAAIAANGKWGKAYHRRGGAIAANGKWGKAYHRRGVARYNLGRLEEALVDLESALKMEPGSNATIDEIRNVRQLQTAKRRANGEAEPSPAKPVKPVKGGTDAGKMGGFKFGAGKAGKGGAAAAAADAPLKKCFIEEIDSDEEDEDEEVVMVSRPDAPSPAAGKRVAVVEESESEGEIIDDEEVVAVGGSVKPAGNTAPVKVNKIVIEEESDDSDSDADTPPAANKPANKPANMAADDAANKDAANKSANKDANKAAKKPASPGTNRVPVMEVDSDESSGEDAAAPEHLPPPPAAPPPHAPPASAAGAAPEVESEMGSEAVVVAAWDAAGRDAGVLGEARGVKEAADVQFKAGLHEIAAEGYSEAVLLLEAEEYSEAVLLLEAEEYEAERMLCFLNRAACRLQIRDFKAVIADCSEAEEYEAERMVCFLNRAACRLQIRDFKAVIADCSEVLFVDEDNVKSLMLLLPLLYSPLKVLFVDEDNVKALVRRGMAFEGLERFEKAAEDMINAMSLEFSPPGASQPSGP
ncbi:hypothetical protein T484DRAFT_1879607 [Baffinella frigidus]|nr:hypothetical protein T484DRAFT_1879607 [Cryptophyta sp. CCMP2293]